MEVCFSDDQNNNAKKKEKQHTKLKTKNTSGRRAHHNALEQKRRGVIRGCFENLRKSVPRLDSEGKKLSRSGILRETARYIKTTRERTAEYQADLDELRLQNQLLSNELDCLESLPGSEKSPLYKDFDSFTKTVMKNTLQAQNNQCFDTLQTEVIQIEESKAATMFPDSFMKTRHQHFACCTDSFLVEVNLIEDRGHFNSNPTQQEREINQKICQEEEFQIDIEGFAVNPFACY